MPTLRRKKDAVATAYKEVLSAVTGEAGPPPAAVVPVDPSGHEDVRAAAAHPAAAPVNPRSDELEAPEGSEDLEGGENGAADGEAGEDLGRVHRRLIRATLPRQENQQVVRPVPEFTMHQPTGRPGKFRGGAGRGPGGRPTAGRSPAHGNGASRSPMFGSGRAAGSRGGIGQPGRTAGRNDVQRPARGGDPPRHGKKQSK